MTLFHADQADKNSSVKCPFAKHERQMLKFQYQQFWFIQSKSEYNDISTDTEHYGFPNQTSINTRSFPTKGAKFCKNWSHLAFVGNCGNRVVVNFWVLRSQKLSKTRDMCISASTYANSKRSFKVEKRIDKCINWLEQPELNIWLLSDDTKKTRSILHSSITSKCENLTCRTTKKLNKH